jgi:tRNA-splicing endonuclease subunit Sen15
VLPSHLREKWTLRTFGTTFDGISTSPDASEGEALFQEIDSTINNDDDDKNENEEDAEAESSSEDEGTKLSKLSLNEEEAATEVTSKRNREEMEEIAKRWRSQAPKRLLLATLHEDSTVVYYIVHDGLVKPRQN